MEGPYNEKNNDTEEDLKIIKESTDKKIQRLKVAQIVS